jgi:hypothetical protein
MPDARDPLEVRLSRRLAMVLPGGAYEPADRDLAATALRETWEEIGVPQDAVTLLGALTPLYVPVSSFVVYPYVGAAASVGPFVCQAREVAEALTIPVAALAAGGGSMEVFRRGRAEHVPCYRYGTVAMWGATAMITAEFLSVWADANA